MKVLISGATGYIGSRVATKLLDRGDKVIGLVRNTDRAAHLPKGSEPLIGTLQSSDWLGALGGVDAVVHAAFPQHGVGWADGVGIEKQFLLNVTAALKGSGRALIASNGAIFLGDS
jgi:nucleoside-diphosphate-sugar epimerase